MCNHHMNHAMQSMQCHGGRHFFTKEEKIEHLEHYKQWLENETKGVKEAIKQLQKTT